MRLIAFTCHGEPRMDFVRSGLANSRLVRCCLPSCKLGAPTELRHTAAPYTRPDSRYGNCRREEKSPCEWPHNRALLWTCAQDGEIRRKPCKGGACPMLQRESAEQAFTKPGSPGVSALCSHMLPPFMTEVVLCVVVFLTISQGRTLDNPPITQPPPPREVSLSRKRRWVLRITCFKRLLLPRRRLQSAGRADDYLFRYVAVLCKKKATG